MLTPEERAAAFGLIALVCAGVLVTWLDTRHPRIVRLVLGDSLALGTTAPGESAPGPSPEAGPYRPPGADPTASAGSAGRDRGSEAGRGPHGGAYGLEGRLDLNSARERDLDLLPGIGPVMARRIVADRAAHGRFRGVDDLARVRGIGPKTLAKLLPYLTVRAAKDSA